MLIRWVKWSFFRILLISPRSFAASNFEISPWWRRSSSTSRCLRKANVATYRVSTAREMSRSSSIMIDNRLSILSLNFARISISSFIFALTSFAVMLWFEWRSERRMCSDL